MSDVTRILSDVEQGDPSAVEQLLPLVYDELRKLAAQRLAQEKPGQTLQATALVHEAYLRLVGKEDAQKWDGSGHFFAAAAEAMRRILVETARRKGRMKHGAGFERNELREDDLVVDPASDHLLVLDEALSKLTETRPELAELVKLRYFAGLSVEQTAVALRVSARTVKRNWVYARAWLQREMQRNQAPPAL